MAKWRSISSPVDKAQQGLERRQLEMFSAGDVSCLQVSVQLVFAEVEGNTTGGVGGAIFYGLASRDRQSRLWKENVTDK